MKTSVFLLGVAWLVTMPEFGTQSGRLNAKDHHSFARPNDHRIEHLELDLVVDFDKKILHGSVTLDLMDGIENRKPLSESTLILDTRDLDIRKVVGITKNGITLVLPFELGPKDKVLGQPLIISLPKVWVKVRIDYLTTTRSTALQWLKPEQTAGKKLPYLFTQSQAIDARSWIPLQDTPQVRFSYKARIKAPPTHRALMSANNLSEKNPKGEFIFEMPQPIPSYLMALAVGDIAFQSISSRTGVFAEPSVLAKAAAEFSDMEKMVKACEVLYGPYQWGRYDVLIMPPSFPFGGMENPRLTFVSPTVLAGDKSLVALLAHELAHSWSGNLVTNATWDDFWLNEGFTVYLERRIMEAVYGRERALVESVLGKKGLLGELKSLPKQDQSLKLNLKGRSPVDGLTDIAYEKGALFLAHLEGIVGREKLDAFLKKYFQQYAFQSMTTSDFESYLARNLFLSDKMAIQNAKIKEWLYEPGLPNGAPDPSSPRLLQITELANRFALDAIKADGLNAKDWTSQEWLQFLGGLPPKILINQMTDLDSKWRLTRTGNSEILFAWLQVCVRNDYAPANLRLETFLIEQGRRKFLKSLYEELAKTGPGKARALTIYAKARPGYHHASSETIDAILGYKP